MPYVIPNDFALANIAKVEIVTEETSPVSYALTNVATEATATAYVSTGAQNVLRVKNTIKAQNNFEDITLGYDIRLVQASMIPELFALIDGGVWNSGTKTYNAPAVGTSVERTPFTMNVYTEEKDINGDTIGYSKFVFQHCKGKPVNFSIQDGQFMVPELNVSSRPASGESPVSFSILTSLPAYNIIAFDAIEDIDGGTTVAPTYANAAAVIATLPTAVIADGSLMIPVAAWVDTDTYNAGSAAEYTFTATLGDLPDGVTNTTNATATVDVVIE